jgi:predicted HicB family RNase H-like nuclease
MTNKKESKDIFDFTEEEEIKKETKSEVSEFAVEEKGKPTKKPFSFYLNVKYNKLLEEKIDQIERKAKRENIKIDINKSKLLEKILDDFFKL